MSAEKIDGIFVETTEDELILRFKGKMYKEIGLKVNSGIKTKEFYHYLKDFVKNIKKLD